MPVRGRVAPELLGSVFSYDGFLEETGAPVSRLEGPGRHAVVILSFGEQWLIDA